jgi:hypothetical protein
MSIGLKIYLVGYLVALIYCVRIFSDEKGRILVGDFMGCLLFAIMSWIGALALWVGQNIKHADNIEKDKRKDGQ